jgi:hypothetical protein
MKPLKLKIILGRTREGRFSEYAGAWMLEQLKEWGDATRAMREKQPTVQS